MVELQKRGRLAEYAYEYTKGLLFAGTLQPGQKVRVEEMVTRLNTSRQPVMDAFKRLAAEGFLEIIPQVGCRVVVPKMAEITDFFLIFSAVEGLAADLAAARRTPHEIDGLRAINERIGRYLDVGHEQATVARAYRQHNREFHGALHVMSHSATVERLAQGLWDRGDFYVGCLPNGESAFAQRIVEGHAEHADIIHAIERGDGDAARELMEAHIRAFGKSTCGHCIGADAAAGIGVTSRG